MTAPAAFPSRRRVLLALSLMPPVGVLAVFLAAPLPGAAAEAEAPAGVVRVAVAPLVRHPVRTRVTAYGTLLPDSDALVSVSYPRAGQVVRLLVRPGQPVVKGAPLAVFATDPAARAANLKARSALAFAQGEVARTRALLAQRLATNSQMAAAEQALRDAEATLAAEQALGGDRAEETLTAPFDGYVDSLSVVAGDRIQPGAAVVRLGRGAGLRVVAGVEPAQAALVRPGMAAAVTPMLGPPPGPAAPPPLTGHVVAVAGMLNPVSRWVDVTIALDPPPPGKGEGGKGEGGKGGAILPLAGSPVRAAVTVDEHAGTVVPRQAVLNDDDGAYLFQVRDGHAVRVAVAAHPVDATAETEVEGDIDPALPVVVLGNYELTDGQDVALPALIKDKKP